MLEPVLDTELLRLLLLLLLLSGAVCCWTPAPREVRKASREARTSSNRCMAENGAAAAQCSVVGSKRVAARMAWPMWMMR
jgi:hypothetical protein